MKHFIDLLLFIFAAILGFFTGPIAYNIAVVTGWLSTTQIELNPAEFQNAFFKGTVITWVVCVVIGIGFFIVKDKVRWIFLLIPVALPLAYGFKVLNDFSLLSGL